MKILFPVAFILISVGLFFFIVDPLYNDVDALRTDVASYNTALSHSTDLQKTRDQLIETYNSIKPEDKDKLNRFLPNTVNNIELILEIEQIANAHGMPLKNIKFQAPQKAADAQPAKGSVVIAANDPKANRAYGVFPLEFTTEGNYETFVNFLKDVEHNLRLVDIKSASFVVPPPSTAKVDTGLTPNSYTYTLKVETYWLK